ncbi:MAG TPA: DUF4180 domain-containing protein [Clostridia bacterium]|nr:DUF4180 domain-containing protein [Clostridia bacterium]
MSIKYAILGLLSWKPFTGYEMKKVFEESSVMYWSGNNNQIYKTLIQLLEEGLVTGEVQHREASPSKKVYTITGDGLAELKKWLVSPPEAPEFRKPFLVRLAWADQLNNEELNELLLKYENEIKLQLLFNQEKNRRGINSPRRNSREAFLWDMISDNLISSLNNELDWVQEVRKKLFEKEFIEQREKIHYKVIQKEDKKYLELISARAPLGTEADALDLVALCGENDTNLLLLKEDILDEGFFMHKTGMAGAMLQKLSDYNIKAAVVTAAETSDKGRPIGKSLQIRKAHNFRIFETGEKAEEWLLS